MNPQYLAALALIDEIFVANGNQEITGTNSNPVLRAILQSLYSITGNNLELETVAKDNLVDAINEVNGLVSQIDSIQLYTGSPNPNTTPPNGGNTNVLDFYSQTSAGNAIALWIKTGIPGIGWLNLTENQIEFVTNLPTTGVGYKLYLRRSDYTLWAYNVLSIPASWIQVGNTNNTILINGNKFEYKKKPTNITSNIEAGDFAVNGWVSDTEFGKYLIYVSGAPTDISSWTILDSYTDL